MNKRQTKKLLKNVKIENMRKKRLAASIVSTTFLGSDNKECAYDALGSRMFFLRNPILKVKKR